MHEDSSDSSHHTADDPVPIMTHRRVGKIRRLMQSAPIISTTVCIVVAACLLIQPDWLAPIILVPTWFWLLPGLSLASCGFDRDHKRRFLTALVAWCSFAWFFVDETRSLLRPKSTASSSGKLIQPERNSIRVITLNCSVGQTRCVEELAAWKPDIVLLQESPGENQLTQLTGAVVGNNGACLHGGDVSILARGRLQSRFLDPSSHFIQAEVELPNGIRIEVLSTRLSPPVPRIDFWMPGFWSDHWEKRVEHRQQVLEIMEHLENVPTPRHLIVGGDFNAPPHDGALFPLQARLADAFRSGGRGWGATGTNEYPLFRVDQIWISDTLQAESVTAERTQYSDHRMVVCDLIIDQPSEGTAPAR